MKLFRYWKLRKRIKGALHIFDLMKKFCCWKDTDTEGQCTHECNNTKNCEPLYCPILNDKV